MNKAEVHNLIDKYYRGDTTLEEERVLLDFLESDMNNEFPSEKAQFSFFKKSREEKLTEDLFEIPDKEPIQIRSYSFGFVMRAAAALILALGLGYLLFLVAGSPLLETSTEANVQSEVLLPDGSHVWVHSLSHLRYPRAFEKDKREVFLDGEAYFEIVKDQAKPFIVHTHEVITQVVGTSFDLRNYGKEENVELTVFAGKVLFGSATKVAVAAGDQMIFEKKNKQVHKNLLKGLNALAWKNKQLQFDDAPLDQVLADLSRYYNIRITRKTKEELNCHFTGSFNNPRLEDMINALSFSMNIQFQLDNGIYYIDAHNCSGAQ